MGDFETFIQEAFDGESTREMPNSQYSQDGELQGEKFRRVSLAKILTDI
jgi:hypothetical protein